MLRTLFFVSTVSLSLIVSDAVAQTFPIRRSTPYARGDRWRSEITSIKTSTGTVTVGNEQQRLNEKETTHLNAAIEIDQVDEDGYALVWLARINRFVGPVENRGSEVLLRPGTVVLFDRIEGELSITDENGAPLDEIAAGIERLLMLPMRSDDAPFEPKDNVNVGDEWAADIESMRAAILAQGPPQLRESPDIMSLAASAKLLATREYRDANCLDVSFTTTTGITQPLEDENQIITKADQQIVERFLIPADYSSDFLDKRTILTDVLQTESKGAAPSLDVTQVTTTDEKRTYVEFQAGGVRPWKAPQRGVPLLEEMLFALSFDPVTASGEGADARILSQGRIAEPLRVKSSGYFSGQIGGAMRFDGEDDHVNVEGAPEWLRAGTEAVTVACWVKASPKPVQFIFDVGFYADNSLTLVVSDRTAKFAVSPIAGGVALDFPLEMSEWTHVAVNWDGRMQRAYVNGRPVAEAATKRQGTLDQASIGGNPFLIGSQSKPASRGQRYFAGQMDEFIVWTRALDAAEIAGLFEQGQQGESVLGE